VVRAHKFAGDGKAQTGARAAVRDRARTARTPARVNQLVSQGLICETNDAGRNNTHPALAAGRTMQVILNEIAQDIPNGIRIASGSDRHISVLE
jgi:hypothetical protein